MRKNTFTGHDYKKIGIVKDARINPLSTTDRDILASMLGLGNTGLLTTEETNGDLYTWGGTEFTLIGSNGDVDGGFAAETYLSTQNTDGGSA